MATTDYKTTIAQKTPLDVPHRKPQHMSPRVTEWGRTGLPTTENPRDFAAPSDWFHNSIYEFDKWHSGAADEVRGKNRGIDPLGLWMSNKKELSDRFGPYQYRYNTGMKAPYLPRWKHSFWGAYIVPEVAEQFLTPTEMEYIEFPPDRVYERKLKAMWKQMEMEGKRASRGFVNEVEQIEADQAVYDKIARKLFNETGYIAQVQAYLQQMGHDSILVPNMNMEEMVPTPGMHTAVHLRGHDLDFAERQADQESLKRLPFLSDPAMVAKQKLLKEKYRPRS